MNTDILNFVNEFFSQDLSKKIPQTYRRDRHINIQDLSIEDVNVLFSQYKDNNPSFGIYVDDWNYIASGTQIYPTMDYEEITSLTDKEKVKATKIYVNNSLFPYVSKRLPTDYKRVGVNSAIFRTWGLNNTYYELWINNDINEIVNRIGLHFNKNESK